MFTRRHFAATATSLLATLPVWRAEARQDTAKAAGFFMPEEAGPHELTFMQWPTYLPAYETRRRLDAAQATIADIANTISEFEPVILLMAKQDQTRARRLLSDKVEIWDIPTEDLWCRDSGPIFVVNAAGDLAISHLNFNGWGERQQYHRDGQVARRVAERMGLRFFDNPVVGEGGGVETDGNGTLLAHASSWVTPERNAASRDEIEEWLLEALGAEKMIWAPGLKGHDITDYHIDSLARFVSPGKVVIQIGDRVWPGDVWSKTNFETLKILQSARDARGRSLEIVTLPDPDLDDWVSSYVNYYVCNGAVLVSETADKNANRTVRRTLSDLYPGREVLMMNTDILGENGGGIHCATQQMPKS